MANADELLQLRANVYAMQVSLDVKDALVTVDIARAFVTGYAAAIEDSARAVKRPR